MPAGAVRDYGGAFTDAWLNVTAAAAEELTLELTTVGKTPTLIGESTMLTFSPSLALKPVGAWALDKLGSQVDPEDVVDGLVGRLLPRPTLHAC